MKMMMLTTTVFPTTGSFPLCRRLKPNPSVISSSASLNPTTKNYYLGRLKFITIGRRWRRRLLTVGSSDEQTAVITTPTTISSPPDDESASEVVRDFYSGINGRDLTSVECLIADNCVYEDLIFSRPFVGRKAIMEFFQKFIDSISKDLQFVIDDISDEDNSAVGVTWHLEWKGKPFPFSKGCSFYRLDVFNGKRQIIYGRDSVEPAVKPGDMALVAIRGVTWLLQQFPQLADQL